MRHPDQAQPDWPSTPSEKMRLPLPSRDERPPLLAGRQWLWLHPPRKAESFALLEAKSLAGQQATGRTGMDLWQSLGLGGVRLGLDAGWDRLEPIANDDSLGRQRLGVPAAPWGAEANRCGPQTRRDTVAWPADERLPAIPARMAAAGRAGFATKAGAPRAALAVTVDR